MGCNNFYVPCERIFQPELEGMSVFVLFNNDGFVVFDSQEGMVFGEGGRSRGERSTFVSIGQHSSCPYLV